MHFSKLSWRFCVLGNKKRQCFFGLTGGCLAGESVCPASGAGEPSAGEGFSVERCAREGVLEAVHTCKENAAIMYLQQRCGDITQLAERASSIATGASMNRDTVSFFLLSVCGVCFHRFCSLGTSFPLLLASSLNLWQPKGWLHTS